MSMFKKPACPLPPDPKGYLVKPVPIVGPFTLQHLLLIISGGCAALTIFISYFLIIKHLHRYTVPRQQRQIIRIIFTPVVYSTVSCLSIINYNATKYIQPLIAVYEAFALASVFLLFVEYVAPDTHTRTSFFAKLENRKLKNLFKRSAGYKVIPGGFQAWYERKWFAVFMYVVVNVVVTITEDITQATGDYCTTSWSPRFAHIWVVLLDAVFLAWAVTSIVKFYMRMKNEPDFAYHKPGLKLLSFKVIVACNFFQNFIFAALTSPTSARTTGYDLHFGIPATIVAGEQIFFAIFFHYSFRSREYHESMKEDQSTPRMGIFRAAANAFNPTDLIVGIFTIVKYAPSLIGRKSSSERVNTRLGDSHLEPMSNRIPQTNQWDTAAYQNPTYKVTADLPEDNSYHNTYRSTANNNVMPPQYPHSDMSDASSLGAASDGYSRETEMLGLARHTE